MSDVKITYSSELMKNYLHAELISPQNKFEALQTNDGLSLLFTIGTDGIFNLVQEENAKSSVGWLKTDLSSAQIKKDFAEQSHVICRTFDAGQSIEDDTVGLAMVVETSANAVGTDHLYLSLGNSNQDISWAKAPKWLAYEYDNPNTQLSKLVIANILFSELAGGKQYIIVDVLRDPSSAVKDISRYYIDPDKTGGYYWHEKDLPIDIEADNYTSCMGRLPHGLIDGIYTSGHAGSRGQLEFSPIKNEFGGGPPPPVRLNLPQNSIPGSMASTRNADLTTDLYVTSGDSLYYFASSNQNDSAQGALLLTNDFLIGASHLYAYRTSAQVFLWALNRANQVIYLSCPINEITTPSSWSNPVPILTKVDLISPYVNVINNGNTFFAVGGSHIFRMQQSPGTGVWTKQRITLPAPSATSPAQSFSSYTTTIQATDANNLPLAKSPILVSSATRSSFFINNLYYILDTTPIPIHTDTMGNITIIETENNLHGTQLIVAEQGGSSVHINPMSKPYNKVAKLNTVSSLKNAVITNNDGTTKPLVSPVTTKNSLEMVAQSNRELAKAYASFSTTPVSNFSLNAGATAIRLAPESFPDEIFVNIGDIFRWLESGVEYVVEIVENAASGLWHFIATIAGKVYRCVLNTVETIVSAIVWVFNAIKTKIEDLIKYLEFLFNWDDILITHRVMKNVFIQFAQHSIDSLSGYKVDIAAVFTSLQEDVNKWADIPNFDQTAASTMASNKPLKGQNSSPANLGIHHYQGNVASAGSAYTPPSVNKTIFEDLLNLLNKEEATLTAAYQAIKSDIVDKFDTLSVTQIIEKFIAIIVDTLLQTAENILLAVVDVFIQLSEGILDVLTAKIEIPVISWLYKEIAGEDLSFLDLICLISAIPATIIYKIGSGSAPFPKNDDFTNGLLSAKNFDQVQSLFYTTNTVAPKLASMGSGNVANFAVGGPNETRLKKFGAIFGSCALSGSLVLIGSTGLVRLAEEGHEDIPLFTIISAVANIAYISPNIVSIITARDNWYQIMNVTLTGISLVKGIANIGLVKFSVYSKTISPTVEFLINLIWNVPVIMNIVKNKDRSNTDYKALIPETVGNFTFNVAGMSELLIARTEDPRKKAIASAAQFVLMTIYGLTIFAAGGITEWEPGQKAQ